MRLQDRPRFKAGASAVFPDLTRAVATVRALSQSALFPSNCRLLDGAEAHLNGLGGQPVLVLGFEPADHPVDAWMKRALELVRDELCVNNLYRWTLYELKTVQRVTTARPVIVMRAGTIAFVSTVFTVLA